MSIYQVEPLRSQIMRNTIFEGDRMKDVLSAVAIAVVVAVVAVLFPIIKMTYGTGSNT